MAYNETLAQRVREYLAGQPLITGLVTERKMFGGLAFMHTGNMFCGVLNDSLMVRVGPKAYDDALARPHARAMDFTGRPMKGMVYVAPAGWRAPADLAAWVQAGLAFARSLPGK